MSCFMVNREHALAIAKAAVSRGLHGETLRLYTGDIRIDFCPEFYADPLPPSSGGTMTLPGNRLAELLLLENAKSVASRYGERADEWFDLNLKGAPITEEEWTAARVAEDDDPIHLIKSIHCYEYQACEHPEWEDSIAYKVCKGLVGHIIRTMPEYDYANWGEPAKKRSE